MQSLLIDLCSPGRFEFKGPLQTAFVAQRRASHVMCAKFFAPGVHGGGHNAVGGPTLTAC